MKIWRFASFVIFASIFGPAAEAQLSDYLGPGILTRGASNIGTRAGQEVDLRFFASASAVYDNGIQPLSLDSSGNLTTVNGLAGIEATIGAYGTHSFQHSKLSLDYKGTYRRYTQKSNYDGSDQSLTLGYTLQASRRVIFDFRQILGTTSESSSFAGELAPVLDNVVDQTSLLFDNRTTYLQSGMDFTYLLGAHTSMSMGGSWQTIRRQASTLVGMNGYNLHGSLQHRLSQRTTIGAAYTYSHYEYPGAFGQTDINSLQATLTHAFTRSWVLTTAAGFYQSEVTGLQAITLDPTIAALLGVSRVAVPFYRKDLLPSWDANLGRNFMATRNVSFSVGYHRGISAGNGVYLASTTDSVTGSIGYTGVRKTSFSVNVSYNRLKTLGQDIAPYHQIAGGVNMTYSMTRAIQFIAGFNPRDYEISHSGFHRNTYRVSAGISFSPGDIPLAFH